MPTLNLVTNVKLDNPKVFVKEFSKFGADTLNKPEQYISVIFTYNELVTFGGTFDPAFSLRIDSLDNISEQQNENYSKAFFGFFEEKLGVKGHRGYVTYIDPGRANMGLPPELLDIIIGFVADVPKSDADRKRALLACHSVSRSLCQISRRYLFRKIEPDLPGRNGLSLLLKSLHEIMTWNRPRSHLGGIARYIKDFTFRLPLVDASEESEETVVQQLNRDNALALVLEALHGPDYGIHTALFDFFVPVSWTDFSSRLQHAFFGLFRSRQLVNLTVNGFNQLPPTILRGTHITRCQVYECGLDNRDPSSDEGPAEETLPLPQLDALWTDHSVPIPFFEERRGPNPESSICKLRWLNSSIYSSTCLADCLQLVKRCEGSLRRLILDILSIRTALRSFSGSFDLSDADELYNMIIRCDEPITYRHRPQLHLLENLARFCNILKLPSSWYFSVIAFVLIVGDHENSAQAFLDALRPDHRESHKWSALDAALARLCMANNYKLNKLIITFKIVGQDQSKAPHGDAFAKIAEGLIRKSLPSFETSDKTDEEKTRLVIWVRFEDFDET
ncbi:hypothetical protein CVT26_003112 [Gymnopilus dilepis]|uniref:L-dopachrome isomerase n=1 Tax=Gymnopilus dilepis TaxID=231916 RepID=A0A409Y4P7_9AGAR|nr:hypothetical protein CVT26_003112 [Gymnopilus dilepis]